MAKAPRQKATGARLSKRVIAAHHRAIGASQARAAQEAHCCPQSISWWELHDDPEYLAAYTAARAQVLREGWGEAMRRLRNALLSDDEHVAVAAARAIVNAVAQEAPRQIEHSGSVESAIEVVVRYPEDADDEETA